MKASKDAVDLVSKSNSEAATHHKQVIDALAAMSTQAIKTAQDSNAYAETIFKVWSAILALIAAGFGFIGWNEIKNARETVSRAVNRIEEDGQTALGLIKAKGEETVKAVVANSDTATLLVIDIAAYDPRTVISDGAAGNEQDPEVIEALFERLKLIEAYAEKLGSSRTKCWVHGQRAVLNYFNGKLLEAWRHQELANQLHVPTTRFIVQQNLACIASRVFGQHRDESALTRSREVLREMVTYVSARQARVLLDDSDLEAVWVESPEIKAVLESAAAKSRK